MAKVEKRDLHEMSAMAKKEFKGFIHAKKINDILTIDFKNEDFVNAGKKKKQPETKTEVIQRINNELKRQPVSKVKRIFKLLKEDWLLFSDDIAEPIKNIEAFTESD